MNLISVLTFISVYLFQINTQKPHENKINIQVRINKNTRSVNDKEGIFSIYKVTIDLINNSDHVFSFWQMTCSWEENWIMSSDSMGLEYHICDYNVPYNYQINPREKMTLSGYLDVDRRLKSVGYYKLGFIFIKENECVNPYLDFFEILEKKKNEKLDIIWSYEFKIPR
jgi:hypothetical protein